LLTRKRGGPTVCYPLGEVKVSKGRKGNSKSKPITHRKASSTTILKGLQRASRSLAGFPDVKITAKNKKLAADLNDRNAIFFNDSAEMPNRETGEFVGRSTVEKDYGWGLRGKCCFPLHRCALALPSLTGT